MQLNLQQCCGEIGAFYNRSSKIASVRCCYKFNNILLCLLLLIFPRLAFYVVIFINTIKNCTGSISKLATISLHLLIPYSFLIQLWIYSHRICLSGDIELNPGLQRHINQCFSVCHWNLNCVASHNFSKIQFLIDYDCIHKFDIICLPESYLKSEILPSDSNLQITRL